MDQIYVTCYSMNTIQFLIKNIDFEKPIDIENDI